MHGVFLIYTLKFWEVKVYKAFFEYYFMAETGLAEFLEQIDKDLKERDTNPWRFVYEDICENPDKYTLSRVGERIEWRTIGIDDIPRKGRTIKLVDNDFYESQSPEFRSKFPELDSAKDTVLVEMVDDVYFRPPALQVKLKIGRYLVQEK